MLKKLKDSKIQPYLLVIFVFGLMLGISIGFHYINNNKYQAVLNENQKLKVELKETKEVLHVLGNELFLIDMYNEREFYINEEKR